MGEGMFRGIVPALLVMGAVVGFVLFPLVSYLWHHIGWVP